MTLKKQLIALVAAAALAAPATARSAESPTGMAAQPGIIAVLIGLLLPAVQKAP